MHVLLTGATGFVGQSVLDALLAQGHHVHALIRPSSNPPIPPSPNLTWHPGSLADPTPLLTAARSCDAAIHLVGIIREHPAKDITFQKVHVEGTRNVLDACRAAGISRYLHMSALGTRENAIAAYHQTKWAAEELVRKSPLNWTIFRPGMITPTQTGPRGEFAQMVQNWYAGKSPPYLFLPYFRPGLLGLATPTLVQPVALPDVARAFANALSLPATTHQTYNLPGPTPQTWPQFYKSLAHHLNLPPSSKPAIPIPLWYATLLTNLIPPTLLPFNKSQLQMAAENNTADPTPFTQSFGWSPRAFA